jgi:hypothetical protein
MSNTADNTTVETVDMDINQILNIGDSVMLPSTTEDAEKKNIFSRGKEDLSFLDKPAKEEVPASTTTPADSATTPAATPVSKSELDDMLNEDPDEDTVTGSTKSTGRKNGLVELTSKLIEKNLLVPFDDDKPIDKYTLQDFEELIEANFNHKEQELGGRISNQFFESLPPEFQYAAEYISKGGTDLKGLFKTLAQVEEVRQMDPSDEGDAKHISRSYLQATNFGTTEEIEEQITEWEDANQLENKASKFKPKLDAMTERQVQYKLAQQAEMQKQQDVQMKYYMDNIYKTLEPGELNGLKLDRKTQNLLFTGLVQPNYQSASGNPTNLLGHLLEKHQYIEPRHDLVAEALWLLADPEGYKARVRENTKKEVVADTVRKLKSEQSNKIASYADEQPEEQKSRGGAKLSRNTGGFFKR